MAPGNTMDSLSVEHWDVLVRILPAQHAAERQGAALGSSTPRAPAASHPGLQYPPSYTSASPLHPSVLGSSIPCVPASHRHHHPMGTDVQHPMDISTPGLRHSMGSSIPRATSIPCVPSSHVCQCPTGSNIPWAPASLRITHPLTPGAGICHPPVPPPQSPAPFPPYPWLHGAVAQCWGAQR